MLVPVANFAAVGQASDTCLQGCGPKGFLQRLIVSPQIFHCMLCAHVCVFIHLDYLYVHHQTSTHTHTCIHMHLDAGSTTYTYAKVDHINDISLSLSLSLTAPRTGKKHSYIVKHDGLVLHDMTAKLKKGYTATRASRVWAKSLVKHVHRYICIW